MVITKQLYFIFFILDVFILMLKYFSCPFRFAREAAVIAAYRAVMKLVETLLSQYRVLLEQHSGLSVLATQGYHFHTGRTINIFSSIVRFVFCDKLMIFDFAFFRNFYILVFGFRLERFFYFVSYVVNVNKQPSQSDEINEHPKNFFKPHKVTVSDTKKSKDNDNCIPHLPFVS